MDINRHNDGTRSALKGNTQNTVKRKIDSEKIKTAKLNRNAEKKASESVVAWFDNLKANKVTENLAKTTIFHGGMKNPPASMPSIKDTTEVHTKAYSNLANMNFYEDIASLNNTKKFQEGTSLINNAIKFDKLNSNIITNRSSSQGNLMNFDKLFDAAQDVNSVLTNGGLITAFDLETMSGMNEYGHTLINNITELASVTYKVDPKTKVASVDKVYNTVLGYTKEEYEKASQLLKDLKGRHQSTWSNEEKVFYERLNIYGNSKSVAKGFEHQVTKAKGIEDINTSFYHAEKGLEFLNNTRIAQESWMSANGITDSYDDYRLKYIRDFRENLKRGIAQGHNVSNFDIKNLNIVAGQSDDIKYFDTYQAAMYGQQHLGRQAVYAKGANRPKGLGPLTQGSLTDAHQLKDRNAAAHIAINDTKENILMTFGEMFNAEGIDTKGNINISDKSYFKQVTLNNLEKVNKQLADTSSKYTGSNQLFYMDYTMQKSRFNQDGALSFEYNPVNNTFKSYDGFTIDRKTGSVENAGFPAFGPRKGALYQHEIYELEMNENFKKQFMNITGADGKQVDKLFQQYSDAGRIAVVKSQEYMDIDSLTKRLGSREAAETFMRNRKTTFTLETNMDRLGANLGVHVGTVDGDKVIANNKAIRGLGFKVSSFDGNNVVINDTSNVTADAILNNIINKSYDRTINDSAARKMRDLDYKKIHQIRSYQRQLVETQGIKSNAPIIQRVSDMISKNQTIDLTANDEIINALGWHDYGADKKKILSESLNNALAMDAHISKLSPVIDTIEELLDEKYGKLDISTIDKLKAVSKDKSAKELLYKKDMAFKELMNGFLSGLDNVVDANSWSDTYHTAADLNRIDFNMFEINPNKYEKKIGPWSRNKTSEVASLDLNNPNSLLNMFYSGRFEGLEDVVAKDANGGYQALTDAYNTLRNDKRFINPNGRKIFSGIRIEDYRDKNISQLNDAMMAELRSFSAEARQELPHWGYINPRMNHDILSTDKLNFINNMSKEDIMSRIKNVALPKDFKLLTKDSDSAVDQLVNEYFLTFKKSDMDFSGFTEQQRSYIAKQYDIAERVSKTKARDLIDSIKGTNIQLAMTETKAGKVLSLIDGDNVTHLNDMFRFNHDQGIMTYQMGTNEYALKMGLGRSYGSKDNFQLTNTVEKIVSGRRDASHAKWASDSGNSVIDAIVNNNKDINRMLRDASARIDVNNGQLFSQGFQFDANEILYALPELRENGVLGRIEKDFNIDKKAIGHMDKVIKDIKNNKYKYKDKAFSNVLPVELNFFTDNYMNPLLEAIIDGGTFTSHEKGILRGVGVESKNSAITKGFLSGTKNYYIDPLARMDDDNRPPVTQMQNVRLYNKDKVIKDVGKLAKEKDTYKGISTTSVYSSTLTDKFLYNNVLKDGTANTNGLTMKYMQIDSQRLRDVLTDKASEDSMSKYLSQHYKKDDLTRAIDVVKDRARRLSTYEQQSNMDARVHDINFHKTNTQTIDAKKKMFLDMDADLNTIKEAKEANKLHFQIIDGKIVYSLGEKVNKGQKLGRFGTDEFNQVVTSKYNGVFRGRYFDAAGNVVSESRINTLLDGYRKTVGTDRDKILDLLNEKYTFKYQVLGLEEEHGVKAFLGASEKTTIDSMKLAIGEIDKGLSKALTENGMGDIVGKVVRKDYLDEVVYRELKDKFGKKGAETFMDRILKERYAFSDAMHSIDMFKDVNFITSLDTLKHSSATVMMHNALNILRDNGQLNDENMSYLFGEGNYSLKGSGKNRQVIIGENLSEVNLDIDSSNMPQALKDALTSDGVVKYKDKAIGHTGIGHLVSVIDDSAGTAAGVFDGAVRGKGVKFSDAMGRNLDRQTYNIDGMTKVYNHYKEMGLEDEFESIFGHALNMEKYAKGELAFKGDYANQSITSPITNRLRKTLLKADYEDALSTVVGDSKYEYLLKSADEKRWGDISVNTAEKMYSYYRGLDAMEINAKGAAAVEKYMNAPDYKKFKQLDWTKDSPDWLDLDIGGQGKTIVNAPNNPYTNNLIIKTGLGDKLGSEFEYLALPRMPEVHAGDTLIKERSISMSRGLQEKMQTYLSATDQTSRDRALESVKNQIMYMKNQVQQDITGKEGLIKDVTERRMEQSFMGKGSGIISAALDHEGNSLFGGDFLDVYNRTAKLDELNAKVFKTAQFNGKSLNRHYAEGKVIDSLFMSEEAFRDMGYFDKDFMKKSLGNLDAKHMDMVKDFATDEEKMKHLLSVEGDSFISVRYPEIMQGSDKITMGYLDTDLKANEMRVFGPTGMSAKLDFDGDQMNAARIRTSSGLSKFNAAIGNQADSELAELVSSVDSSIAVRATTDNQFWEREVQNFMSGKKGLESMSKGMDIKDIAKHKLIDGKSYLRSVNEMSELQLKQNYDHYAQYMNDGLDANSIMDKMGKDNYVAAKAWQDRQGMITAKVYHNAIGETNVTNQKIKSAMSGLMPKDLDDYEYRSNLMYDFLYQAEEAAISSKSSIKGLTSDRAQQWNRSVTDFIEGNGDRAANKAAMTDWLTSNIKGSLAPELYYVKSDSFANKMAEQFDVHSLDDFNGFMKKNSNKVEDMLIGDIVNTIEQVAGQDNVKEAFQSLRVGTSQSGASIRQAQDMMFIKGQNTNLSTVLSEASTIFNERKVNYLDGDDIGFFTDKAFRDSIDETIEAAAENVGKTSTEDKIGGIIQGIGEFAKSVSGKKLAMGAVGIAAGIMVAGYVGGRPRPADVHAMEEAEDYQTNMEGYQLADPGMSMMGQQQGYVININARTDKGRDNAVQALQQAVRSGANSNINISMNITDNYGNINDRDIEKAIMGAF